MEYSVGIDISKGKSTVVVARSGDYHTFKPIEIKHTSGGLIRFEEYLSRFSDKKEHFFCLCEETGNYSSGLVEALVDLGYKVYSVNPKIIKDFGENSLHTPKTDKADARKIAIFGLYRHNELKEYSKLNRDRDNLKLLNRQRILSVKHKTAVKNSLISLSDKVYPGVNKLFAVSNREDGREKWVDFFYSFWHIDCVRKLTFSEFDQEYQEWCERTGYNYSQKKAEEIYENSSDKLVGAPADPIMQDVVQAAVSRVNHAIIDVQSYTDKLITHAREMPEYPVVREMEGVSALLASRLIAELGDVRRFHSRTAITAFAGVDPGGKQSGSYERKSNQTSKKGSSDLRQTLYLIMDLLLKHKPEEDEVYKFMDKKRSEGKKYRVYTTAGANKFLRIYLARVKEYLNSIEND